MESVTRPEGRGRARRTAVALVASSLLTLVGCGTVYTVEPVGSEPVMLDPLQWNGWWATRADAEKCRTGVASREDDCLAVTVVDAVQGLLAIAEPGKDSEPTLAYVRRADEPGLMFITLEEPQGEVQRPATFVLAAFVNKDTRNARLAVWGTNEARFRELVNAGTLPPGPSQASDPTAHPTIGPLDATELELVSHTMKWELFEWDQPVVYVRVASVPPAARPVP